MANAVVKLEGSIINSSLFEPKEGQDQKSHQKIDILQVFEGGGSNIETVKEFDLTKNYKIGSVVALFCVATVYYFNNKPGVSYKIFEGDFKALNISEGPVLGNKQPTK
jgi:hypothetical protein